MHFKIDKSYESCHFIRLIKQRLSQTYKKLKIHCLKEVLKAGKNDTGGNKEPTQK